MAHGFEIPVRRTKPLHIGLLWLAGCPGMAIANEIALDLPLRCELGSTCFIQNYVDHDPSTGTRDYQCGRRTYDGHDGTDIRVLDLKAQRDGVVVTAAADGTVAAIRDGVEDVSIRTIGKTAVAGRECGNGAVIEHGEGWQTQYCHLAKGSVRIKAGNRISRGDIIGLVGLSGATEFPHLHFTVRHVGRIVDPFAYGASPEDCGSGHSIWKDEIREQVRYRPSEVLNIGLSGDPPTLDMLELGNAELLQASMESRSIVAYVRVIGLQQGDQETLLISDTDGNAILAHRSQPIERDQAQHLLYAGRKRKDTLWASGRYRVSYSLTRAGQKLLEKSIEVELRSSR